MKGKTVAFRPNPDMRQRLETLASSSERSYTWIVKKCVEAHLPILEQKYAEEIRDLLNNPQKAEKKTNPIISSNLRYPTPQLQLNEARETTPAAAPPPAKKRRAA